jgi:hypothetical protein
VCRPFKSGDVVSIEICGESNGVSDRDLYLVRFYTNGAIWPFAVTMPRITLNYGVSLDTLGDSVQLMNCQEFPKSLAKKKHLKSVRHTIHWDPRRIMLLYSVRKET